jgi:hypothetical protein
VTGYRPDYIVASDEKTELEIQERISSEYSLGIAENKRLLDVYGWCMRIAWSALALAPAGAAFIGWLNYEPEVFRAGMETLISLFGTLPLTS